ncbi:hypothetical protein [Micromonospora globbae]|uniref:hypothetical protein n=1 Tax=Micromonospora globbae TaxID=1894969 RepID=UPI003418B4A8
MTGQQLTLNLPDTTPGTTRCGYCACRLTRQPAGDWACNHCRPHLARIANRTANYRRNCR